MDSADDDKKKKKFNLKAARSYSTRHISWDSSDIFCPLNVNQSYFASLLALRYIEVLNPKITS